MSVIICQNVILEKEIIQDYRKSPRQKKIKTHIFSFDSTTSNLTMYYKKNRKKLASDLFYPHLAFCALFLCLSFNVDRHILTFDFSLTIRFFIDLTL